ncbi:MAG: hypothetical protein AAF741_12765 [Bacteroidota bacterium]
MLRFLSISFLAVVVFGLVVWFGIEYDRHIRTEASLSKELRVVQNKWTKVGETLESERRWLMRLIKSQELSISYRNDELLGLIYSIDRAADDMIENRPPRFYYSTCKLCHPLAEYTDLIKKDVDLIQVNIEAWLRNSGYFKVGEVGSEAKRFQDVNSAFMSLVDQMSLNEEFTRSDWAHFKTDVNYWALSVIDELAGYTGHCAMILPTYELLFKGYNDAESGLSNLYFSVFEIENRPHTDSMELWINGEILEKDDRGKWRIQVPSEEVNELLNWDVYIRYTNALTGEIWESEHVVPAFSLAEIKHVE